MKPIQTSKRSIKKRILKELRKLFPNMCVFVRKRTGFISPGAWNNFHTYENWRAYVGKRFWSRKRCEMEGHLMEACDSQTLLEMIRESKQRISGY